MDVDRKSALHWASQNGSPMCCQMLLMSQSTAMVNGSDKNGNSCLHLAAAGGHANVVKVLARVGGIHLQAPDNNGRTPLHWAAAAGHEATVAALLDLDCNPTCKDASNKTPLEYAKSNKSSTQKSCVRLLKKVSQDWQGNQRISRKHLTGAVAVQDGGGVATAATGGGGGGGGGGSATDAAGAAASGRAKLNAVAKISRAFAASKSTKGGAVRTAAQRAKNNGNVLTEPERRLSADPGLGTLSEETEVSEAMPIEDLEAAAAIDAGPDPMRPQHDPLPGLGSHAPPSDVGGGGGGGGGGSERPMSRSGEIPALKPRGSATSFGIVEESADQRGADARRAQGEAADLSVLRDMVRSLQNDLAETRVRENSKQLRISTLEEHVQFWKDQARQSCPNCLERNGSGGSGGGGNHHHASPARDNRRGSGGNSTGGSPSRSSLAALSKSARVSRDAAHAADSSYKQSAKSNSRSRTTSRGRGTALPSIAK